MSDPQQLIEKLKRIEALFAGAATPGERQAAGHAMERILERLRQLQEQDPAIEYRFTFENQWSRRLFVALLRRYGIEPYRYYRQRYTTVMARVPKSFVDETLWPEYLALDEALQEHLNAVATEVISQAVSSDTSEAREVPALGGGAS